MTLMVAFTPVDPATSDYDSAVADKHNAYLRHQADQFILKAAAVFAGQGIQVQQRILTGTPISAVIATEADEGGYDLVALGSRGMGMAENAENYLGSVAERVIRRVTVPVLVIPLKGGSETDAR